MYKKIIFCGLVLFPILTAFKVISDWQINPEKAKIGFMIRNAGFKVNGSFGDLKGSITFDENDLQAGRISASIGVSSIDTGIKMRDRDLLKEEYFDVEKYPRISFTSSSFSKTANGFEVAGKLTIKEVTKTVTIPFTFKDKVFDGSFILDRLDYGVGKSSWVMGDEVTISFSIPVSKEG